MAEKKSEYSHRSGAAAYLFGWLSGLIMYFMKKEDSFVRFHAVQSILLSIVLIAVNFALEIVAAAMQGWELLLYIPYLIAVFAAGVFLMYNAYKGERYKLPIIGDYAEKYSA